MREKERRYWVAFSLFEGIGPLRFASLMDHFGSANQAWRAPAKEWEKLKFGPKLISRFFAFRQKFNPEKWIKLTGRILDLEKLKEGLLAWSKTTIDEERQRQFAWVKNHGCYQAGVKQVLVVTWQDNDYPPNLQNLSSKPPVLFFALGEGQSEDFLSSRLAEFWQKPAIAVVGTRRITAYGRRITSEFVAALAQAGVLVVSGMARGVDGLAHQTALKVKGATLAVLGSGVDVIYPPEHTKLYQQLVKEGLVVSEFPPGMPPIPGNFPSRNRIIAGLSQGVLVTEATADSGSLITARLAAEAGREVWAIPGPITSKLSAGTNWLLQNGAGVVTSPKQLLEALGLRPQTINHQPKVAQLDKQGRLIWEALAKEQTVDELVVATGLPIAAINQTLSRLELSGLVTLTPEGKWART